MAVTIRDIARECGVAASTVSRALADDRSIGRATKARVAEAAERLGYRVNRSAQGLITGRTRNLGLIVPDLRNPFFADVAKGVQTRARERGFAVFVSDADESPSLERTAIDDLSPQVDGLLICSPRMSDEGLQALGIADRAVLLHRRAEGFASVVADIADGMRQAITHLHALGHSRIAYLGGPTASWSGRERGRGMRSAAQDLGIELRELGPVSPDFGGGLAGADAVLASGVSAVIAFNDLVAVGLLSRFAARGVRVPEDVSVVGFDDILVSAVATPALTTVSVPRMRAGEAAVEMHLERAGGRDEASSVAVADRTIATELVVRASTVPAPS
ncbi:MULTISPECIES: LacI family DNA-binding transcriptional regulator [unclassified Rathayibacter]|uniref:LacI family DNA-binding transcriptional regulator n=1 Tax=unclassified Rathayibacter TaxID=2609250 RepID=UPI000F4CCE45|nr:MULTISPECIES: LacI family DNA-binding transcriptional regulator [unclassified Rathayibacter]ROP49134.1 LacI family transcriptional regulator [Rathayibacter sp. PhB186]ROS50749.1 LacI family transcriptional regulator [Rathayibacter sp. PhB185]